MQSQKKDDVSNVLVKFQEIHAQSVQGRIGWCVDFVVIDRNQVLAVLVLSMHVYIEHL
jgi:hypothetical protein